MVLHYLPSLVTVLLSIAPSTYGACNFPESWRNPEQWFRTWDSQGIADYWLIEYRASKYWWRPVFNGQGYDLDVDFVCYNEMGNDTHMYYTLEQPTFATKFCAFSAESTNSLANKYKTVTGDNINSGADIDVSTCSTEVDGEPLTIYPKFPFSDFGTPSCPFSSGEYQVEYTAEGGVAQCADDESSVASVYDGVIRLSTCYNGMDSYVNPLNENLTCVDTYPEALLGDGGGDMLLLAEQSDPDRPKFYCARFNEVALTVTLSLNTENEYQTYCKPNVNSETDDTGYVAFRMTRTFDFTLINETCNFPPAWTSSGSWWIGSAEIASTLTVPVFNDYTQEQIDTSLVLNGATLTSFATECYVQLQESDTSHIFIYNNTGEYFCNQEIIYNNLIFHREVMSANFFTVLSCDSDLQSQNTYRVYLQAPLSTTFTGVTLPMADGEYQATYSESYAMSNQCAGDQTSTATISGQTMTLNLCDSSNSYERPYQMTFTALANWSATELGADSADGDFILLADSLPTDDGDFDLWCARYQVNGDTIYLSLTVTSSTSVECNTGNDATYYTNTGDQKIRAFVLRVPGMTTTEAAMTTTEAMTTAEVTTQTPPTCDFQSGWTDADHWWIGTAWISGIAVPFYNTYTNTVYSTQLIASGTTLSSFDTSCTSFSVESTDTCYYTFEGSSGHTCIKESVYNDTIIIRKDTVRATPAYVASDCSEALASVTMYRLLLRSPLADYFSGVASPFTQGTYQVTYSESSNTENRCAGDSSSVAIFDASSIALDTCSNTNNYEQPYQTTFQIVAAWNAAELEGDSADGDYLLLSSNTLSDGAQAYVYCARYKVIDEAIYISIGVMSELKFECDVSRDYSYYSNGENNKHRAFIFTPVMSTTAEPSTAAPSTAEPSTAAPSTAEPSTAAPSTAAPSTEAPSTAQPSTAAPSTAQTSTAVAETTTEAMDMTTVMLDITTGNCSFPALWKAASQWWIGTAVVLGTAVPYYKNYESNEISTDLVSGGTLYHAVDTACILMGEEDPSTVYYTYSSDSTQLCVQAIIPSSTPEIIFRKEISRESTAYTLNECRTLTLAEDIFNLYLQAPLDTVFPGETSPFTEGIYQATYSASSTSMNNCAGDATSVAVITGSTISLQTCSSTNTYSEPYQSTLYVISSWTADALGADSDDGDFLLLTNALPSAEEMFDVYCARYKVVDSVVTFSLYVHSNVGAHCDVLRDYMYYSDNVDDEFRAFQLTFMAEIPPTTQPPTTTVAADVTTTQAAADATTTQAQPDVTSQSQQDVTTQAAADATMSTDGMATTAASDSAQHVTIVADGDYYAVVAPDEQAFIDAVTPQIATEAGVDQNRVINVEATAGSIILDFDILPGDSSQPGYKPVSSAVSMLQMAVDMGSLNFTLANGTVISSRADSLATFVSPPDGPCASGPCLNGATCVDRTISLPSCQCADGYSGDTCQVQGQASSSGGENEYQSIIIGICAIAGVIVFLTFLSIMVCYWRRREQKEEPEYHAEDGGQFGFARSWTAGYMQFGSNAYGGGSGSQSGASQPQQDQGYSNNNIYSTMLSTGSSYPSATYGYR